MTTVWNKLAIRTKLLVSVGAILAIFTITLAIDFGYLAGQERGIRNITTNLSPALSAAREERQHFLEMAERSARFHLNSTPERLKHYQEFYGEARQNAGGSLEQLSKMNLTPGERAVVSEASAQVGTFDAAAQRSFAQKFAGHADQALKTFLALHTTALSDLITKLNASVSLRYDAAAISAINDARKAEVVTVLAGIVAVIVSFLVGTLVGRSISTRLQRVTVAIGELVHDEIGALVSSMKQLAAGDLTAKVVTRSEPLPVQGSDEPAQLAQAYNELLEGVRTVGNEFGMTTEMLSSMVARIKESAEHVTNASREIADGTTNLSQRTEEQASGLEETASSMEQFTATVNKIRRTRRKPTRSAPEPRNSPGRAARSCTTSSQ